MMNVPSVIAILNDRGVEVTDADEHLFDLFSTYTNSSPLGMLSTTASTVSVSVGENEYTLTQSPTLLRSTRKSGTTGAVAWSIAPLFASWCASPTNFLVHTGILDGSSTVLELGAGVSPLSALALSPRVGRYILSDQDYVLKLLTRNLEENLGPTSSGPGRPLAKAKGTDSKRSHRSTNDARHNVSSARHGDSGLRGRGNVSVLEVDWETTAPESIIAHLQAASRDEGEAGYEPSLSALIATDCVFNPAIIDPFVDMLAALSSPSPSSPALDDGANERPVICIVAQQLRSPDVFSDWLEAMLRKFRVWRVEETELCWGPGEARMVASEGYVVHACLLKCAGQDSSG